MRPVENEPGLSGRDRPDGEVLPDQEDDTFKAADPAVAFGY